MDTNDTRIRRTVAAAYHHDARHFLHRFSLLPLHEFDKAGRIKNFVDVLMAAECALKAHIFMGRSSAPVLQLYRHTRRAGHKLASLAELADFLDDRAAYERIARGLTDFSVDLRYSLDAWETFFPSEFDGGAALARYQATVANAKWRNETIADVRLLIESVAEALTTVEDVSIKAMFEYRKAMAEFMTAVRK